MSANMIKHEQAIERAFSLITRIPSAKVPGGAWLDPVFIVKGGGVHQTYEAAYHEALVIVWNAEE